MKINEKKTSVLVYGREKTVVDVCLKGERLGQVESFTYQDVKKDKSRWICGRRAIGK
jgi:hypothetical protein